MSAMRPGKRVRMGDYFGMVIPTPSYVPLVGRALALFDRHFRRRVTVRWDDKQRGVSTEKIENLSLCCVLMVPLKRMRG